MTRTRSILASLVLAALLPLAGLSAQSVTLKMAANVPANSPWDIGLKRLASEFDRVSGGRVKLAFPQSAHVATETDIIQKMRFGVDGALLTTFGIADLYPDSLALSMPGAMRDDAEFDAVLAATEPLIKAKLADRYTVLAISKGGWIRYFSRSPINYPADLAKLRLSVESGNIKVMELMQSFGVRVVKGSTSDFLLQINSGTVDACCVSPVYIAALWSQLRGKIGYMSSYKVAPFIGAVVFNKSSWEKVPAELRPRLEEVVLDMAAKISLDSAKLEADAIAALDGIASPPEPPDAQAKWDAANAERRNTVIAGMFSADILQVMDEAIAKARKSK